MSFTDSPSAPRAPRKARPRLSLKMQAIGFLSRREHSRQELRRKLLDALRKRAREEAAWAAAAERAAQELAQALREQPSNGIDDAFAPSALAHAAALTQAPARGTRAGAGRGRSRAQAGVGSTPAAPAAPARAALETLTLASGSPLPASLRARLATVADAVPANTASGSLASLDAGSAMATAAIAPVIRSAPVTTRTAFVQDAPDEFTALDDDGFDPSHDEPPSPSSAPLHASDLELSDPEAAVDQLLDWLVANKYLSEPRFVESRVNARSRKQGTLLIKLELSRHGLTLEPEQAAALRETEFARAQALWQRKFGEVAADAAGRAKQARFLASRGFSSDVVRRIVGGEEAF